MTPEYLEHLADLADPGKLWHLSPLVELTLEESQQRDTGIALRRQAAHVRRLNELLGTGHSLLITPMSHNATYSSVVRREPRSKRNPNRPAGL